MAVTRATLARGRARARRFWREYTRMRTAIFLLMGVAAIVLIGSFVPQQDTSAQSKVDAFLAGHPNLNGLTSRLGLPLTQVFVSPVFYVLVVSLYTALGACVLRRARALVVRTLRGHPRTPQYWGEWGSWVFHASFYLLLVAVLVGKATGFQGLVTIREGSTFTEGRAGFDTLQEGVLFDGRHAGFQVRLNRFTATYAGDGQARDYVSDVTVVDHGRAMLRKQIRVNDFLAYRGVDMYQQDYGWAPRLVVRNPQGRTVFDGPVEFFGGNKAVQTGVLKVPDFGYALPGATQPLQLGARMAVFPDARTISRLNADGTVDTSGVDYAPGGMEARNPVIELQLFVGDLRLTSSQNVNQLDTSAMQPYFAGARPVAIALHDTIPFDLPAAGGGTVHFTVSFPELRQYSLFLVKQDAGVPLVYVSFALIMAGLMVKLYVRPLLERRARASGEPGAPVAPRRTGGEWWDEEWQEMVSGEAPDAVAMPQPAGGRWREGSAHLEVGSEESSDAASLRRA